jgi:hypothetical protein
MARSHIFTSLILITSLASGCAGNDGAVHGDGGANQADPQAQKEPTSDSDTDGLPADQDLCPGTTDGAKVDGNGCSAEQRANGGGKGGQGSTRNAAGNADTGTTGETGNPEDTTDRELVPDGDVTPNGFAVFTLDPDGAAPVVFRTLASNVKQLENGFALAGTVMIDVPNDEHVTLLEAKVSLAYDSAKGTGLQSFNGSVKVPFPGVGYMKGVKISDPFYASVGYDLGKNLTQVDAPLKDERKYLYFTFSAGFDAQIGDLSISGAANQSVTMTLDPSDPAFFLKASLGGLMGPVDEASVGFSIGGHLPFVPENTWGISKEATTFDGHLWIGGKVNLNDLKLPLAIAGQTVVDIDLNDDGKTIFTDSKDGFQFGSNSELDVSVSAGLISFEMPIAQSTVVGRVDGGEGSAFYSGIVKSGNSWMPVDLPLKNTAQLKTAGHASTHLEEMYLKAEGNLSFDAGKLGSWTGIDLNDLALAKATLNIDKDGVTVTGTASAAFSPYVGMMGNVDAVGYFNGHPNGWYVTLDGRLVVSGIDLSTEAHARLDKNGMLINGKFQTPISLIDMTGSITKSGVDIEGHAEITIPIVAGKDVAQWVTDKTLCGTEAVADAAVCGADTVQNGAKCGYNTVTSAAQCGSNTVKSAAECGTTSAANAVECGTHSVTSAAQCGVDVFSDIVHCGVSCVTSIFSSCSCSVAKSCNVASTCTFPNTCKVAATCDIAKTCSVPRTCDKVKTCETHVTVPDFNYGSFKGIVNVKIGTSGLEGAVEGDYCGAATGSSCSKLAGGRVKVTSGKPEACVDVAGLGEFCAPF